MVLIQVLVLVNIIDFGVENTRRLIDLSLFCVLINIINRSDVDERSSV